MPLSINLLLIYCSKFIASIHSQEINIKDKDVDFMLR